MFALKTLKSKTFFGTLYIYIYKKNITTFLFLSYFVSNCYFLGKFGVHVLGWSNSLTKTTDLFVTFFCARVGMYNLQFRIIVLLFCAPENYRLSSDTT
jgi:hypothetical protein